MKVSVAVTDSSMSGWGGQDRCSASLAQRVGISYTWWECGKGEREGGFPEENVHGHVPGTYWPYLGSHSYFCYRNYTFENSDNREENSEDHGVSIKIKQAVSLSHCRKWRTNTEMNFSKVIFLIYTYAYWHTKHTVTM